MSNGYEVFAQYYDTLTQNIDYRKRALYFDFLLQKYGVKPNGLVLDLACGTGSLSEELDSLGYDVIGVDNSPDMLSIAMNKKFESGKNILYICQDMRSLNLYGNVDAAICALDSINIKNKKSFWFTEKMNSFKNLFNIVNAFKMINAVKSAYCRVYVSI